MKTSPPVALLLLALTASNAASQAHGGKPVAKATEKQRKAAADAEFNQAKDLLDRWCQGLAKDLEVEPRNARATLHLADCRRLNGQLAEAEALLAKAETVLGHAAMMAARRTAGAGRDAPPPATVATAPPSEELWNQACDHFTASLQLDASLATALAVSACHLRRGDLRSARDLLGTTSAALEPLAASGDDFRVVQLGVATALASELARMQPTLTVRAPTGFRGSLTLDGKPATPNTALSLDPGPHTVAATTPRGAGAVLRLDAQPTTSHAVALKLDARASRSWRLAFWGLVGASAVATISAGALLAATESSYDKLELAGCTRSWLLDLSPSCPTEAHQLEAKTISSYNTRATYFEIAALSTGALLAATAVVYFVAPKEDQLRLMPAVASEEVGVVASGRF